MGAKNTAASFLSAKADQPVLNLHLQESSDALDKHAMAQSALLLDKKFLELEEHAAAEKEFMANAVSSLTNALSNAMGAKNTAASFLSAKADQPVLNLHIQESSDALDKHEMAQ